MKRKAIKKPNEFFTAKTDKIARKIGLSILTIGTTATTTLAMIDGVNSKWIILCGALTAFGSILCEWFKPDNEEVL